MPPSARFLIALGLDGLFHPGLGVGLVPTGKVPPNLAVSIDATYLGADMR